MKGCYMNKSETITKIAPALLKAQKEIGAAVKGSTNPFFKSNYADLGAVMETCKDALNSNGIAVLQPVGIDTLETILLHESGEWISETMNITAKSDNNPQDQGSAITYARRYSLQSMVFIPAEDDDGNKATPKKPVVKTVVTPKSTIPRATTPLKQVEKPTPKATTEDLDSLFEGIDGELPEEPQVKQKPVAWTDNKGEINRDDKGHTACIECGRVVGTDVEKYSLGRYKRVLCRACQKKA